MVSHRSHNFTNSDCRFNKNTDNLIMTTPDYWIDYPQREESS